MDQDKNIMEEHAADQDSLKEKQKTVKSNKKKVEKEKVALESQKTELLSLKSELDKQVSEKEVLIGQLEEEFEELEDYKMGVEEEEKVLTAQEKIINQAKLEAQQKKGNLEQLAAEEKRKKREAEAAAKREKEKEKEKNQKPSNGSSSNGSNSKPPSNDLTAGGSGVLSWPTSGRLSSPYGPRSFNGGGFHYGLDIAAPQGTFVGAAASGVVTRADYSPSYGNVVYIYHPELDLTTVYAHLHSISTSLNAKVSTGQGIGTVGNTGASFGNHLHFETHEGAWQQKKGVDPNKYLK